MSHIVTIKTEVRDSTAVLAACRRLSLSSPIQGKTRLFSGEAEGLAVQLPNWQYPVVCNLPRGQLHFDNFGGRWGEQRELDRFLQAYAVEKAKIEAWKRGHSVSEQSMGDGSIKLTIHVGEGAA